MQTHYDVLGVSRSATTDEIKSAYRKLCMQTHPDVAGSQNNSTTTNNTDRFKRISEAYAILGNEKERRNYDFELKDHYGFRDLRNRTTAGAYYGGRSGNAGSGTRSASFGATLPRNLFIGSVLGFVGVTLLRMIIPSSDKREDSLMKTGHKQLVQAWQNPHTGRWETPRPWDPMYQKLQPELQLIPRDKVHDNRKG